MYLCSDQTPEYNIELVILSSQSVYAEATIKPPMPIAMATPRPKYKIIGVGVTA
jgi:hypothetical protein